MSKYRHFCYRAHWLELSDESKLELERIFALSRFIENHITTKYQHIQTQRINPEDFTLSKLWVTVNELYKLDNFQPYTHIDGVFIDSVLFNIADLWRKALTKGSDRPEFRKLTDDQIVWIFDQSKIVLYRDRFQIPGVSEEFPLNKPKIRLFGEPVCYYLHRDKVGNYYVVFLYERTMAFPYVHADPSIGQLGNRLQSLLDRAEQTEYDSETMAQAAILRKRVLIKLLDARSKAPAAKAA